MEIPFIGGAYSGRSTNLNAQVCQNLYPEMDQQGGTNVAALFGTPGLKLWTTPGTIAEVRALYAWKDNLYAVVKDTLYRITALKVATNVGTLNTRAGKVWIAGGTTHLCIVDGVDGYYQTETATTLTKITDSDFPDRPTSLAYQDGYFIVTDQASDSFWISSSEDASAWDGLDFASAEDTPDDAIAVISHNRNLWVFGEETTELFVNSGDTDFPFTRVSGGIAKIGTGAAGSLVAGHEGLFGLDNKWRVRQVEGYQAQVISTPQVEYHISEYEKKDDARGYTYTQEGHVFYVLSFPSADKTWVYDASTKLWHMRSSGLKGRRHRSNCCAFFDGKHLVGDYENGKIYELDLDTYSDNGDAIRRIRAAPTVKNNLKRVFHYQFEVKFEAGTGLNVGQGTDPQAMLDWSDDGGHTWSNEHWASMGKIGEYDRRAVWRRLGQSRERVYRVTITDPIKVVMIGAQLETSASAT